MSLQIKDSYATIFEPEVHDKFVACNLSTGRKLKEVDDYGVLSMPILLGELLLLETLLLALKR